jgi:hypothetical protein
MAFDPNQFAEGQSYPAQIIAVGITESDNGNPGINLTAETSNGRVEGCLWITPATRERVVKTFQDLGLDPTILGTDEFWDDPGSTLVNVECSVVPEVDTYEPENPRWRVKWWNGKRRIASQESRSKAANLFRSRMGTYVPEGQPLSAPPPFAPAESASAPPPFGSRRTF